MRRFAAALGLALIAACGSALGQAYPSKPIRLILAFVPGIGTDVFARRVGPIMGEQMGQPIVIENRAGASGAIGAEAVFKAAPDGYTMLFCSSAQTVALAHTVKDLPYDPNGFTPIMQAIDPLLVVVIRPSIPAANMREFIDLAKKSPGKLTYGTTGVGSSFHMFGELLNHVAGINILHVPYKGTNLAVNDIMGGVLDMSFGTLAGIGPLIQAGKVRAIALYSDRRSSVFPGLVPVTEEVPGLIPPSGWFAFWGPPRLPDPIARRFHAELLKAMNTGDMKAWYDTNGFAYIGSTPEQLLAAQKAAMTNYSDIMKVLGNKLN